MPMWMMEFIIFVRKWSGFKALKRHFFDFYSKKCLFFYIKILVSEQGNTICEKTIEFSQIVDYEERQKGLS